MYGYLSSFCTNSRTRLNLIGQRYIPQEHEGQRPSRRRSLMSVMGFALFLLVGPLLLWHVPFIQRGVCVLQSWAERPYAVAWLLPATIAYCALGFPRQVLCFVLGASLGVKLGLVEASLAYGGGAFLGYSGGWLWQRWHPVQKAAMPWFIKAGVAAPLRAVLCARLLPVGSALLVSVSSGMMRLAVGRFVLATMLGGVPQNLVFLLAGHGVEIGHGGALIMAIILALSSAGLAGWVLRGFHQDRQKAE